MVAAVTTHHPIDVRAWSPTAGARGATLLLQRSQTELLPRLWASLREPGLRSALTQSAPRRVDGSTDLQVYQPVHRSATILVADVVCDVDGAPRVDPRRIVEAGVVVRRVTPSGGRERWVVEDGVVRGWRAVESPTADPDPDQRAAASVGPVGPAALTALVKAQRLRAPHARWAERTSPLFVAPPEVCAATGRTLLVGVVPTASAEVSADPVQVTISAADAAIFLSPWWKTSGARTFPRAGQTVSVATFQDATTPAEDELLQTLQQAREVLDLFGTSAVGAAARAGMRQALAALRVTHPDGATTSLLTWLQTASDALISAPVRADGGLATVALPQTWPAISAPTAAAFAGWARQMLEARAEAGPPEGRFEDPNARYVAVPYVRVACEKGCPPKLRWGPETEIFRIAPWFATGPDGAQPARIVLPELDRATLSKIAPNVSFLLPGSIKAFLEKNDPKAILAGDVHDGGSLGIQFICSFSIPIITLCAFILLWILIYLLNLVFWWLPFVVVCLPFPKRSAS